MNIREGAAKNVLLKLAAVPHTYLRGRPTNMQCDKRVTHENLHKHSEV